jgi:hypothetical protein
MVSARGSLLVVVAALAVGTPLAWLAGEQHRENCISQHRTSCSVLPWESGTCAKSVASGSFDFSTARPAGEGAALQRRAERITRLLCEQP